MKLRLQAHGRSYQLHDTPGLGAPGTQGKITRCMLLGVPYERALLEYIYTLQLSGTAVDAGANVGNHTMWLAVICGFWVIAFEPIVFQELARNVALNDLTEQVVAVPVALGAENSTATYLGKGRLQTGGGAVPVRTLDSYRLTDVALIKIDVEGMEPAVLLGGEQTIRRDHPVIFAEEWDTAPHWHDDIAAVLEPWGYRMRQSFSGRESTTPVGEWVWG